MPKGTSNSKVKGFQKKKKSRGEVIQEQGSQVNNLTKQLQALQQFTIQNQHQFANHLQAMQRQVDELSNLIRLSSSEGVAALNDWVVIDLIAYELLEDGSASPTYISELTTLGTSFRLEKEFTFFSDLVDNLLGKTKNSNVTVDVVIPDNYPNKALIGKKVRLDCTLINVFRPTEFNTRIQEIKGKIDAKAIAEKQAAEEKAKAEKEVKPA